MTSPKQKPKVWKAWGIFTPRDKFMIALPTTKTVAKVIADYHGHIVRPVTITLAKPARRRGKAK